MAGLGGGGKGGPGAAEIETAFRILEFFTLGKAGFGRNAFPFPKGQGFSSIGWVGFTAEQGLCGRWRCASGWIYKLLHMCSLLSG